jgi:hypothetical protein
MTEHNNLLAQPFSIPKSSLEKAFITEGYTNAIISFNESARLRFIQ